MAARRAVFAAAGRCFAFGCQRHCRGRTGGTAARFALTVFARHLVIGAAGAVDFTLIAGAGRRRGQVRVGRGGRGRLTLIDGKQNRRSDQNDRRY